MVHLTAGRAMIIDVHILRARVFTCFSSMHCCWYWVLPDNIHRRLRNFIPVVRVEIIYVEGSQ